MIRSFTANGSSMQSTQGRDDPHPQRRPTCLTFVALAEHLHLHLYLRLSLARLPSLSQTLSNYFETEPP